MLLWYASNSRLFGQRERSLTNGAKKLWPGGGALLSELNRGDGEGEGEGGFIDREGIDEADNQQRGVAIFLRQKNGNPLGLTIRGEVGREGSLHAYFGVPRHCNVVRTVLLLASALEYKAGQVHDPYLQLRVPTRRPPEVAKDRIGL